MKSLFWKTAYPCLGVRLCAFLVDLKSLWPCPDEHGVFSLGLVSCLFLLSHRGFSSFVSFFCLPFTPLLGRCFHWHNFVTNSRTEQFSQISCKLLYKCLEYSGSVFCLCSFCHVAWLITMLSLMTQSLLTRIGCRFAFCIWSPPLWSFFTKHSKFLFPFLCKSLILFQLPGFRW